MTGAFGRVEWFEGREIFDAAPDGMLVVEASGIVVGMNRAAEALLGYEAAEVVGRPVELLVPERSRSRHEHHREAFAEHPARREMGSGVELTALRKDGREVLVEVGLSPSGDSGHTIVSLRDVTERRQAQRRLGQLNAELSVRINEVTAAQTALRESEARFRRLAENAPDVIFRYRLQPTPGYEFVSPAIETITGYTPDECYANPDLGLEMVHPDDRDLWQWELAAPSRAPLTLRVVRKDGELAWVETIVVPLRGEAGNLVAYEGITRDVTERVLGEERRRSLETRLQVSQKLEVVGHLACGIAHDLNNVLTVILGWADLMVARNDLSELAKSDVALIRRTAEHAGRLVRHLLALGANRGLEPVVFDLNEFFRDIATMLRWVIDERVELAFEAQPNLWPVRMDPVAAEQIVLNLALNARDAMPEGGRLVLSASTSETAAAEPLCAGLGPGPFVLLSVSDTGVGMDEATQLRIFEPFFTTKTGGTGLGLATVLEIVEQSGGNIVCQSEPGRGTTFSICLPCVEASLASGTEQVTASTPTGSETVLVVEDENLVRELAATILDGLGYTVLTAASAGEALSVAREHQGEIRLLLTDVVMPGMSGVELARQVTSQYPGIRAAFMSGHVPGSRSRSEPTGPDEVLISKPFTVSSLGSTVREALDVAGPGPGTGKG
jgi:PAS domain S-box-containing protein